MNTTKTSSTIWIAIGYDLPSSVDGAEVYEMSKTSDGKFTLKFYGH